MHRSLPTGIYLSAFTAYAYVHIIFKRNASLAFLFFFYYNKGGFHLKGQNKGFDYYTMSEVFSTLIHENMKHGDMNQGNMKHGNMKHGNMNHAWGL